MKLAVLSLLVLAWGLPVGLKAQAEVELQPFAQQTRRLEQALVYLGQPLSR